MNPQVSEAFERLPAEPCVETLYLCLKLVVEPSRIWLARLRSISSPRPTASA